LDEGVITEVLTSTPATKRALAEKLGVSTREVEAAIQEARLDGAPILSSADGYWLSQDPAEIRACASRLRDRAITQLRTASALGKAADELPMVLWR
jgi:biotin operon repressor